MLVGWLPVPALVVVRSLGVVGRGIRGSPLEVSFIIKESSVGGMPYLRRILAIREMRILSRSSCWHICWRRNWF